MDARQCGKALGLLALLFGGSAGSAAAQGPEQTLRAGLEAMTRGENAAAVALLGDLVADHPTAECAGRAMCAAGQALQRLQRHREALEFFHAALDREDATLRRGPILLAAALSAFKSEQYQDAAALCRQCLAEEPGDANRSAAAAYPLLVRSLEKLSRYEEAWEAVQRAPEHAAVPPEELDELGLSVAMAALQEDRPQIAATIFRWALERAETTGGEESQEREGSQERHAQLQWGLAWAEALSAPSPAESAERLLQYARSDAHPAARREASRAAGRFLMVAGEMSPAVDALLAGLEQPERDGVEAEAWDALARAAAAASRTAAAADARHRLVTLHPNHPAAREHAPEALVDAVQADDPARWSAAVAALRQMPDATAIAAALDALERLPSAADAPPASHRLVDALMPEPAGDRDVAADETPEDSAAALEAALCRWLAARQRWSRLSDCAGAGGPEGRGVKARRWIAEGLYRTGRAEEALRWFKSVVGEAAGDAAGETEPAPDPEGFAIRLRTAELAARLEPREAARQWIERAAEVADDASQQSAVDLVAAELAVRSAALAEARGLLEAVARRPDAPAALAARAQWMIGETWFMQERFSEALESYRRVETMPEGEAYQPLALLQAGKCFERLGRPRDAVICYSALLSHPAGAPHAEAAQARLATLQKSQPSRQ